MFFFNRFIISSQCKQIQLWYNQSSLCWPVLGVFSCFFHWYFFMVKGYPIACGSIACGSPRRSPSRQGLFTSEQKADPTPRLFVPLSHSARLRFFLSMGYQGHHKKINGFFFSDIYLWMWKTSNTTFWQKDTKGPMVLLSDIYCLCYFIVSLCHFHRFAVFSLGSWSHAPHLFGAKPCFHSSNWLGRQEGSASRGMQKITFQSHRHHRARWATPKAHSSFGAWNLNLPVVEHGGSRRSILGLIVTSLVSIGT